ncbi:hypothetical protein ACFL2V_21080 [Pseudomonadota bacterium]
MYIKAGNTFGDVDLEFIRDFLEHLDIKFTEIGRKIKDSPDPDSYGLFDKGEYYIGVGFTIAQRYITSTYPQLNIGKKEALKSGPEIRNNLTFVEALNAGANFWKHQDEWGLDSLVSRNIDELSKQAQNTIRAIEIITPWADYTCSNLLAELVGENEFKLASLLPPLEEWRNDLDQNFS